MIYDFGMNNGGSLAYFLTKDRVVGIDANPAMCDVVRKKFSSEIKDGRLTIVQAAVSDSEGIMPFYVHKTNPGLSQMPLPQDPRQFNLVDVPTRTPVSIVQEYGEPSYIKIDVEYLDHVILENLFSAGIFRWSIDRRRFLWSVRQGHLLALGRCQHIPLHVGIRWAGMEGHPCFKNHPAKPSSSLPGTCRSTGKVVDEDRDPKRWREVQITSCCADQSDDYVLDAIRSLSQWPRGRDRLSFGRRAVVPFMESPNGAS